MIIQGSNEPVVIEFRVEHEIKKVNVAIFDEQDNLIKDWSFGSVDITNNTVVAPLTEQETMDFPVGILSLEIKWLDNDDNIWHSNVISFRCSERNDKRKMLGGDSDA